MMDAPLLVPTKFHSDVMAAFLDDVADGKIRAGEIGLRFLIERCIVSIGARLVISHQEVLIVDVVDPSRPLFKLIEHGLGDWGRGIAFGNNQANIETAVYYRCLQCG
jgi:hypothetical protein